MSRGRFRAGEALRHVPEHEYLACFRVDERGVPPMPRLRGMDGSGKSSLTKFRELPYDPRIETIDRYRRRPARIEGALSLQICSAGSAEPSSAHMTSSVCARSVKR